jgi:hypothetical protein
VWNLEKLPNRGTALGSTSTNTFEGHRFEAEEDLLIRETIQNAKDVPAGKEKPKVVFRAVTLTGAKKAAFLKALDLKDLYGNGPLIERTQSYSELRTIAGDRNPLGLIYIEDFNTTGLDGALDDPTGNWMRFNLHGDAAKLEQEEKIGSYGFGKAVLARASGTNTFLVYSAVKPMKDDPSVARLMGHTFQPWFREGRGNKSGRGWLCESLSSELDPIPYTDKSAHRLAEAAGFTHRKPTDTGSSFLLIGNKPGKREITIDAIRRAVETWWWPSIVDNQLDVELWQDGKRVAGASPKLRPDLVPYIACKAKLDTGVGEPSDTKFQRELGKQLGRLALILAADETVFDHPLHPKAPGPRRVARMRAASGMVTEYKEFGTPKRVAFVGFFAADRDVDEALKYSEPAEHDEWAVSNQRLARTKNGKELVRAIEDRTQTTCYTFQRENSAARGPTTERLQELERMMGAAFAERDNGAPPKKKKKKHSTKGRLTVVDYPESPNGKVTPNYGKASNQLDFLIRYKLKPEETRGRVLASLKLNIAENAQCERGEPLMVEVIDQSTSRSVYHGTAPSFRIDLMNIKSKTFRVKTDPYPRHQVVIFEENELRIPEDK